MALDARARRRVARLPALGHLATNRLGPVIALAALRGLGFGIVTACGATAVASFAESSGHGAAAALWRVLAGPIAALVVITASGGAILTFTSRILVSPALGFAGLLAFTGTAAMYSVAFGVLALTAVLAGGGWAWPGLARRGLSGRECLPP